MVKDYRYRRALYVYRLKESFERAYFAGEVKVRRSGEELTDRDWLSFVTAKNAVLTLTDGLHQEEQKFSQEGEIKVVDYQPDHISLEMQSKENSFVVLSETNNPFWKLFVDGRPAPYSTVNLIQTGFVVPSGQSRADFVYCPSGRIFKDVLCSM